MISEVKIRSNYFAGQQLIIAKPIAVLLCLDTSTITYHASLVANDLRGCVGVAYDKDVSQKCIVHAHHKEIWPQNYYNSTWIVSIHIQVLKLCKRCLLASGWHAFSCITDRVDPVTESIRSSTHHVHRVREKSTHVSARDNRNTTSCTLWLHKYQQDIIYKTKKIIVVCPQATSARAWFKRIN